MLRFDHRELRNSQQKFMWWWVVRTLSRACQYSCFQLLGYWMFGKIWCDVHGALDVLLSTSSIMNLCLISLDRFVVTQNIFRYFSRSLSTSFIKVYFSNSLAICS